jgi:hypothetical protein
MPKMLYNFPRSSPRLLVGVLAILSLCFIVQWQHSQRSELWTIPKLEKVVNQKEVLQSFIARLHQHPPARDSLELPEGLQILRIEEISMLQQSRIRRWSSSFPSIKM